jgi:hypothetical protein
MNCGGLVVVARTDAHLTTDRLWNEASRWRGAKMGRWISERRRASRWSFSLVIRRG